MIEKPITAVTYPRQVLAAASYPVRLEEGPPSCTPQTALDQMPRDGALLQVFEYNPGGGEVPDLPPRPGRITYADGEFANFECADSSLRFAFSDGGRAFQGHIWMNRRTVDPQIRTQAIEILNGFRAQQPADDRSVEENPAGRESAVVPCDTAFFGPGSAVWRDGATQVGGVGFWGTGRDFSTATGPPRGRWRFVVKTPLIVEGSKPVTVAIAPADRHRAALAFRVGDSFRAYAEIRFVPCRDQPRTAWPGGFFLADRQPIRVLIREPDGSRSELLVGRL